MCIRNSNGNLEMENNKKQGNINTPKRYLNWKNMTPLNSETRTVCISDQGNGNSEWSNQERYAQHGNLIRLLSGNINAWSAHGEYILGRNFDILALQETRLGEVTKVTTYNFCKFKGYTPVFGKGIRAQFLKKKADKCAPTTAQGGVAVLAKDDTMPGLLAAGADSPEAKALYEQGRYVRAAVPVEWKGKRYALHIISMHNVPQNTEYAELLKERNNARMFEDAAEVGEQPVILCIDSNQKTSEVINAAIRSGRYVDVAQKYADQDGPEPTYCNDPKWDKKTRKEGATTPDRIIVNRIAWDMITHFEVVRDAQWPGHLPLLIEMNGEMIANEQTVMQQPKALAVEKMEMVKELRKIEIIKRVQQRYGGKIILARKEKKRPRMEISQQHGRKIFERMSGICRRKGST